MLSSLSALGPAAHVLNDSMLDVNRHFPIGKHLPTPPTSRPQSHVGSDSDYPRIISTPSSLTKECIVSFLFRLDIPFPEVVYDHQFDELCSRAATSRGYPLLSLAPFIPGGVVMSTTAYVHLTDQASRIIIALYTAFLIYLDDIFQHDINVVRDFNHNFICGIKQSDPVLDAFASLLRELSQHWTRTVANLMIASTLNLVTALLLEFETSNMPLAPGFALGYPTFSRTMSGASEAYALFVFPRTLRLPTYIQALPEMMVYINNGNDVLSFYKEELAGEAVNRVTFLASVRRRSKHQALNDLTDDAIDAHTRILGSPFAYPASREAFKRFSSGYVGFHAGLRDRYKLQELDL